MSRKKPAKSLQGAAPEAQMAGLSTKIDGIDAKIVQLLNQRTRAALDIGQLKQKKSGEIYVPAREKEVLLRTQKLNRGPLKDSAIKAIFREIMSASLAAEKKLKVAYMGPAATFSHQAARSRFGTSVEYAACESVSAVFELVEKHGADYGVVPIENSIHGAEAVTLDSFLGTNLKICAEIILPVSQCLLSLSTRDRIKRIYSHPQALGQCARWLKMEMPGVELVSTSSTAKAAELAAVEKEAGALASSLAAEIYRLNIIAPNIEDVSGNQTRFMVLARSYGKPTGDDKTSLIFSVSHKAGSLYNSLQSFKKYGLNMTKIESRPSKSTAWEYCFFVDLEGHTSDRKMKAALGDLQKHCAFLKVLGSYPRAV